MKLSYNHIILTFAIEFTHLYIYLQAIITMIPEAWQNDLHMPQEKRAFYRWSAYSMEPWDGPGMSCFFTSFAGQMQISTGIFLIFQRVFGYFDVSLCVHVL